MINNLALYEIKNIRSSSKKYMYFLLLEFKLCVSNSFAENKARQNRRKIVAYLRTHRTEKPKERVPVACWAA